MRSYHSSAMANSPGSSDAAGTVEGSPDTRLTAYSPEDVRGQHRAESAVFIPQNAEGMKTYSTVSGADPFFAPVGQPMHSMLSTEALNYQYAASNGTLVDTAQVDHPMATMSYGPPFFTAGSEQYSNEFSNGGDGFSQNAFSHFGNIGPSAVESNGVHPFSTNHGRLDIERRSRAFVVEGVPMNLSHLTLASFFSRREFESIKGPLLSELNSKGTIFVAFTDSRDAKSAMTKVHVLHPEWRITPLTAREYARRSMVSNPGYISDFEGQVSLSVFCDGCEPTVDHRAIASNMKDLVASLGDVKAFKVLPIRQDTVSDMEIEFHDVRDADNVVSTLNRAIVGDFALDVRLHQPDVESSPEGFFSGAFTPQDLSPPRNSPRRYMSESPGRDDCTLELSPTGRSIVPKGDNTEIVDMVLTSIQRPVISRHQDHGRFIDHRFRSQNQVDIDRIRRGLDVRTTVMLRNIPNKVDQSLLKEIVDQTSFAKYDFMYLRIDFANNCNVGYAFINFEDPIDIIDFVNARAGHNWNCFNSDKVAEVSYATIQGRDCLVQKFRNSSVMLEDPSFRPKIFHTGTGPLAGIEDHFPGPDNLSKMRRSVENAEHVGLYAPGVNRDDHRRRQSRRNPYVSAAPAYEHVVYVRNSPPELLNDTPMPPSLYGDINQMWLAEHYSQNHFKRT